MVVDYLKRSEDVVIPCRPNSDDVIKIQRDLSSETVTWTDAAGRDLDLDEGHLKVDAEKNLVLQRVQVTDAGVYVCKVKKMASSDRVTVVRHVVKLNGIYNDKVTIVGGVAQW